MRVNPIAESLEDRVYLEIRAMILAKTLVSGQKLVQEDLAERLGVSRTPLRSAIARLERENFVAITARGEAQVAEFGLQQIIDVFEIRAVLEGLICRLLAPQIERKHTIYLRSLMASVEEAANSEDHAAYREADVEFHTYLTNLVADGVLNRMLDSVQLVMSMALFHGILRSPKETYVEHLAIIDALESGNADEAERVMIEHIRKTIELLRIRLAEAEG
ncbi:MAG: GntR family transcriptional regulator [Hyphomicrobiales bacterium]